MRKQFTFYRSYYTAIQKLPPEDQREVSMAIFAYALDHKEPTLSGIGEVVFELIRPTLDTSRVKAENGKAGGSKPQAKRKQTASKKEKEKEKEVEVEVEKEKEVEIENEYSPPSMGGSKTVCDGFLRFWEMYPVKIGKQKAYQMWKLKCPDGEAACRSLEKWKASEVWTRENGRFIPRAAKFLEEEYYLQAPESPAPKGVNGGLGQAELDAIAALI